MRKTYVLHIEGKNRDRLLDAARHDIHRYLRRERRRTLPEGARFWDFDCRFGATQDGARSVREEEITGLIDAVARSGDAQFYVEIVARPGEGMPRKPAPRAATASGDGQEDEGGGSGEGSGAAGDGAD
ncbi:DUF6172 family protein [Paracidovorax konjaci]|uniref:Uncharacterized protein n=1 Tax=Paracidovorax konjaci TaxID=32040 RepID=A0A1I1YWH5_9BURK|nr:DUF6172 family protein [Paracidovorax konjaci]SFE22513.1 hypothetical protein SAMN04489710_12010 [Paracidovorax konjaci]